MAITEAQARQLRRGAPVYGSSGVLLGHLGQVYIDDDTSLAAWISVDTGPAATGETLVPLNHAVLDRAENDGPHLVLPYDTDELGAAPHPHSGAEPPTTSQQHDLYRHYAVRTR